MSPACLGHVPRLATNRQREISGGGWRGGGDLTLRMEEVLTISACQFHYRESYGKFQCIGELPWRLSRSPSVLRGGRWWVQDGRIDLAHVDHLPEVAELIAGTVCQNEPYAASMVACMSAPLWWAALMRVTYMLDFTNKLNKVNPRGFCWLAWGSFGGRQASSSPGQEPRSQISNHFRSIIPLPPPDSSPLLPPGRCGKLPSTNPIP